MLRNAREYAVRFFCVVVFIVFLQAITAYAGTDRTPPGGLQNPAPASMLSDPLLALQSVGLGPNWNIGPVSISAKYDSLLKGIAQASYSKKLSEDWAAGLIGEAGPNNYRLNGTLGTQQWNNTQFKLTGEYLEQRLPFEFSQGKVSERVSQSAMGAKFRHVFDNPVFKDVEAGGYWAYVPGKMLPEQTLIQNSLQYTYQRNIAGSNTRGANIGTDMLLTPFTTLNVSLLYDSVNYDTKLTSAARDNRSGLGASLKLEQIISDDMKLTFSAEDRTIQNSYASEFHWSPVFAPLGMDVAFSAQRFMPGNQLPSSNIFGISFSFALNDGTSSRYRPAYTTERMGDLLSWVKEPAVRMNRVQVMAEQKTTLNGPVALSLTPNSGPVTGGGTVTITGSNFLPGVIVTFNGVNADVVSVTPTQIVVTVPDLSLVIVQNAPSLMEKMMAVLSPVSDAWASGSANRTVDIVVRNTDGQSMTFSQAYTFVLSDPVLTSISPTSGSTLGGTSVTLTGEHFTNASSVTFGGTAGTSLTVVSDTSITVTTPAHSAGAVDVVVTIPQGTGPRSSRFTYVVPSPTVTSLSPNSGSTVGGTSVTLTGTHFTDATSVTFGGDAATGLTVVNDTTITVTTPAHAAGTVDVVVTTPQGSGQLSNGYTYVAPAPTITGISPSSDYTTGGASVTITGTGFTDATAVNFGSTAAASYVVNSATSITATAPAGAAGTVDITVTTPGGTSATSSADQFTYNTPPHVIFVTTNTYTGNLQGLSGANQKCNSDPGKPGGFAADYSYKALLNGNNATVSGTSYYRTDGTTLIATATGGNLVGSSALTNSIAASGSLTVWTGANGNSCSNWTSTATTGDRGASNSSTTQYWFAGISTCSTTRALYCVSQ